MSTLKNNQPTHDSFFTKTLSNLEIARNFLTHHLPQPLLDVLDLNTLVVCKDKFITHNLEVSVTDILYQVHLKQKKGCVYIYTLTEHQSTPQKDMPLRVTYYECLTMKNHYENYGTVPLVYTLVYYNGNKKWNYEVDLKSLINAPRELVEKYALKPFQLIELNQIEDRELRKHKWSGIMGMVMKHIYDRDILPVCEQISQLLSQLQGSIKDEFITSIIYYIYDKGEISDEDRFQALMKETFAKTTEGEITMVSLGQQAEQRGFNKGIHQGIQQGIHQGIEQGIQQGIDQGIQQGIDQGIEQGIQQGIQQGIHQGIERGIHQGEIALFVRLLKHRFKSIPDYYLGLINHADSEVLSLWSERFLEVTTLEEIFNEDMSVLS